MEKIVWHGDMNIADYLHVLTNIGFNGDRLHQSISKKEFLKCLIKMMLFTNI